MADTPPASGASTPTSSAAEQSKTRKERREAKIRAGGSARLNKITGLGGGIPKDPPPQPPPVSHADPEEVNISEHYYVPPTTSRSPQINAAAPPPFANDDTLRQMMLGLAPPAAGGTPPPGADPFANLFAGFPGMEGLGGRGEPAADNPLMKMMMQIMDSVPGEGKKDMPAFPRMPGQAAVTTNPYAYLWRIVHAVFAISLGLYIAFTTTFTGTKFERERSGLQSNIAGEEHITTSSIRFFYIFATAEVLLQSSRFWLEKGRVEHGGIFGMILGILPEPYKSYLTTILRYSRIWTTVSADAMALVFVLGVCSWLRGGNVA